MDLLILGAGWVGEALRERHPEARVTHRRPREGALAFDLAREETWEDLPSAENVVWTFPAAPADRAIALFERHFARSKVVVLGSASAYVAPAPDSLVDEETPLDLTQPRVAAEEALRLRGAAVLHLAGLWGPGRDPLRWLSEGRIRNGGKYVNLVHLDDVLAAIDAVFARFERGLRLNVSDGLPRRWTEHVASLRAQGRLAAGFQLPEAPGGADSKRVSNERLRARLPGHRFQRFTE
jgi:nucleoside-diphosphate-sugar epimerase